MATTGITITVDAETAAASANLTQFFGNLNQNLVTLPAAGKVAASGLSELRHTSILTREAFHGLEATALLLGGTRMPMLANGIMAGRMALMSLHSAAGLTGASLGVLAPAMGAVALALGAAGLIWHGYTSETQKAAEAQKDLMDSMSKLPALLGNINELLKARRMSAESANEYSDYLTGRKKLYKTATGDLSPISTETVQQGGHWEGAGVFPGGPPTWSPGKSAKVQMPEANMGEVQEWVSKQLGGKGGLGDTSIESINKLKDLQDKVELDALSGLKREETEIHAKYEGERDEIRKTMDLAKLSMTPKERQAGLDALGLSEQNEASAITAARFKQDQEDQQQAEAAFDKQKEATAKAAQEAQAKLERDLTLLEAQEGDKRGQLYETFYQQRIKLAESQLYAGEIDENEYTRLVEEATIKRLDGRRKEAEETIRLQQQQIEQGKKQADQQMELIKSDPYTTEVEKAKELLPLLQQQYELTQKELAAVNSQLANPNLSAQDRVRLQGQQIGLQQQGAGLSNQISSAQDLTSFSGQFNRTITDLQNQWGSFAKQTATTFSTVFNSAIQSISKGITGLIMGTMTWGQALRSIASTILTTLVQAIVEMGVRWMLTQVVMAVFGKALAASTSAAIIPIAMAQSAIWSTPAALATMASWGGAAAAAPAQVAAGIGATMMASLAEFSEGGFTGVGGRYEPAGIVHRNEFVFSEPAVRGIGAGRLAAIHSSYASGGLVGGGGRVGGGGENHIHVWGNMEGEMMKFIQSTKGRHTVVNIVGGQMHKLR